MKQLLSNKWVWIVLIAIVVIILFVMWYKKRNTATVSAASVKSLVGYTLRERADRAMTIAILDSMSPYEMGLMDKVLDQEFTEADEVQWKNYVNGGMTEKAAAIKVLADKASFNAFDRVFVESALEKFMKAFGIA